MSRRRHQFQLRRIGVARGPEIIGERAEQAAVAGEYWRGPAGAQAMPGGKFTVIRPQRISRDIAHDDLLPPVGCRPAVPDGGADCDLVDRAVVTFRKAGCGADAQMRAVRIEQQDRAQHARCLRLHGQHELVKHIGKASAGSDQLEQAVLSVAPQLCAPPRGALVGFPQGTLDHRGESAQAIPEHVVGGAALHSLGGKVLGDRPRDEDERDIRSLFLCHLECPQPAEAGGQAEIGENDMRPEFVERATKVAFRIDATDIDRELCALQLVQVQLCVALDVLHHQDFQGLLHGLTPSCPAVDGFPLARSPDPADQGLIPWYCTSRRSAHIQRMTRVGCGSHFIRRVITGMSSLLMERLETNALAPASFAAERWLESSNPETMTTDVWGERSRTNRVPSMPSMPGRRKSMRTMSTCSVSTILSASRTVPASRS